MAECNIIRQGLSKIVEEYFEYPVAQAETSSQNGGR